MSFLVNDDCVFAMGGIFAFSRSFPSQPEQYHRLTLDLRFTTFPQLS
jgi:hypothetical protein